MRRIVATALFPILMGCELRMFSVSGEADGLAGGERGNRSNSGLSKPKGASLSVSPMSANYQAA